MAEHPNVQRLREGFQAFQTGDMEAVLKFFHEDILWHVPGDNVLSGDYKGHEEVMGFFGRLMQETGGSFKLELHDVLANGQHGVGLVRQSADRNGKHLELNVAQVFHINDEGRVTEFWGLAEDTRAVDEFWAES